MNKRLLRIAVLCVCASAIAACKKSSTPTAPTTTVTTVELVSPAANLLIPNASQPITLAVKNAAVTGGGVATYVFEVATDSAFANKIATRSGVTEGVGGQTTVTLDTLSAGDYYWRGRAEAGGTAGPLSGSNKFSIGAAISVAAPSPLSPSDGSKTARRPTFRVQNAVRSGPVGAITYKFEVATSATFTTVLVTSTVSEGATNTDFTPASDLPTGTKLFWRVTAIDAANSVASAASTVQSVTTSQPSEAEQIAEQQGVSIWPGAQPPGTPGQSALSRGWEIGNRVSYDGQPYFSPQIEALRLFDLMDRGMDPDSAIDWLAANGYPSTGQWYAEVAVIGIPHTYLALIGGAWELVHRAGG